ncbi:hypothetical protein [Ktedonobacter sp. SOSP1-52]|uniref:hypothetical protein n=1 Tax=Ktedonobacter sp. SOSP1-52 TaxID=2778366 RepID=UPI001916B231|nr:hypothetical protein [Ktedonobacter sp. SOSP1-52]
MQAQAETKRQKEAEAFTRLMELRKQQQLKKLGLRQPSPQVEEKGAAIPEAEVYYTSAERKTPWLDKGARPVELPGIQPHHSTPVHEPQTSTSQRPMPALQQPTAAPRRGGIFSVLRNWFRPRRP